MTDLSIVDNAFDSVGSAGEAALDTIVGGVATALDTATRPRRSAGRARRRGSQVNEELVDTVEEAVGTATALPERVFIAYLRTLRRQARRQDPVGTAARTLLSALHRPARDAARFFTRVERETDVRGTRTARRGSTATATRRTSSTRGASRTAGTGARSTATTRARRAGSSARGTARRVRRSA